MDAVQQDLGDLLQDVAAHLAAGGRKGDQKSLALAQRLVQTRRSFFPELQTRGWVPSHGRTADFRRPLPDRVLRTPGTVTLQPSTIGRKLPINWPCRAKVYGVLFSTIEGTPQSLSALSVQIMTEGTRAIFTDGFDEAFIHMAACVTTNGLTNVGMYPLDINVDQGEPWQVTVQNESTVASGVPATPVVQFAYYELRRKGR